jgi:DNA (cytosine-5)-methyltransferase 1
MAAETFYHNFVERISDLDSWAAFADPRVGVREQASRKLVVKELQAVLASKRLLSELRDREIDVVVGGPPCQGFSSAGKRDPEDLRNQLPWQFLQFVAATRPKAVVIENVSGMQHDFKKRGRESPFQLLATALETARLAYVVQPVLLNAIHYGVPQHRPRVMLIAVRQDLANAAGLVAKRDVWKSDYGVLGSVIFPRRPDLAPKPTHDGDAILTVADAIGDLDGEGYRASEPISKYAKSMRSDISWMPAAMRSSARNRVLQNHVLRQHTDRVRDRFRVYQYFRHSGIPFRALGILAKPHLVKALTESRDMQWVLPAVAPDGTVLARTRRELADVLITLGTKKHSQRAMIWGQPSNTVMSIPDDLVHPEEPRTMTVRELARFQSFPDAFEFRAKQTTGGHMRRIDVPQYTQVANAVPPRVAEAVGHLLKKLIGKSVAVPSRKVG